LLTKLLHAALVLSVLWQLAASEFVKRPRDGYPGNAFYDVHRTVGMIAIGLIVLFLLWNAVRRRETPFSMLFPWLSSERTRAVIEDFKTHLVKLRQFQLPAADVETPLASAVHGLGLVTALAMGVTGAWLYTQSVPAGLVLKMHKAISNLMWAYVVCHAGLALLHQFMGHAVLRRMFGR
jgi:cytochrome b561